MIRLALAFDVVTNHLFGAMLSYGACEISICPEFSTPQLLLYLWAASKYLACRQAFDKCDNLCHAVCRNTLDQEMHMIIIGADLKKLHLIPFFNLEADILQLLIYSRIKYRTSIFCWKYQMIYQHCYIVALLYILTHPGILRRKRRGIQPEERLNVISAMETPQQQENALNRAIARALPSDSGLSMERNIG